jgi:hypothetical protein
MKVKKIRNRVRLSQEILVTCDDCGGKVPAKRQHDTLHDEDYDQKEIGIKVGKCPTCELKIADKMEAIYAIDTAFKNLFGLERVMPPHDEPGGSGGVSTKLNGRNE